MGFEIRHFLAGVAEMRLGEEPPELIELLALEVRFLPEHSEVSVGLFEGGKGASESSDHGDYNNTRLTTPYVLGRALIIAHSFMAHLFNRTDYYDYRSRVYANIKKTLENKIDLLADALPHAHTHPIETHD